jgi:uncharacterized protein
MSSIPGGRTSLPDEDQLKVLHNRPYFFDGGLKFTCRQCGACCNGAPGVIYVSADEIGPIADFAEIPKETFISRCLYPFQDSYSIREDESGRCIFYEQGCAIYPVRPIQCRTFPFWVQNLRSIKDWRKVAASCPGIDQGHLYTKSEIFTILESSYRIYEVMKDLLP